MIMILLKIFLQKSHNYKMEYNNMRDINQWPYNGEDGMSANFRAGNNLWIETNLESYWNQLECLPPIRQNNTVFMVGECYTHRESDGASCYAAFIEYDGRYFGKINALKDFDYNKYIQEIIKQFDL